MATQAQGTTFKFTPTGGSQTTVGMLSSIGALQPTSADIDVTTLDSTAREYIQGLRDPGRLELEGFFSVSDAGQAALRAAYASGTGGTCVITFPDGTTATFSAHIKGFTVGAANVDGAVGFKCSLRLSGGITIAGAVANGNET